MFKPLAGSPGAARGESSILVTDTITHTMAEGLGFNWYSTYRPEVYPDPGDDRRWERIFAHADWLNMRFVRFGQDSSALSDKSGAFVPGHPSFAQLRRLSPWCAERGVNIVLDPFSIPAPFRYQPTAEMATVWGRPGIYSPGVADIDGYVRRFVVPYVRHVVREMGCTAVKWFNHINEPLRGGKCATPAGVDDHRRYVEVLAAIRQGLDEAGLEGVGSMAPDTCETHHDWPVERMREIGCDADPFIRAYCMHTYRARFDWAAESANNATRPMSRLIDECMAPYCAYAHARGKPYLVTEHGMFHYGWSSGDPAGVARHDNALLEAELVVRSLACGVDGMLRWAWLNPGDVDGWWQLLDTVGGEDRPLTDPYYSYGTLMRFVEPRAAVLDVRTPSTTTGVNTVHPLAVHNPNGSRSLLVVNDHYSDCAAIKVVLPTAGAGVLRKIVNDSVRKHQRCGETNVGAGGVEFRDVLTPMSLTVYTTSDRA